MKLFDTRKKFVIFKFAAIVALLAVMFAAILLMSACNRGIICTDTLEPEMETIDVTSPAITLPNKPDAAPTANGNAATSLGTPSISSDCYSFTYGVEGESLFTVSYKSDEPLPAYAYVYIPVTNYNGKPYLKIKADCNSVERLAVLAVYYEQFDLSRPAVAVYNNSVMDGENLFICKLNEGVVLDSHYGVALGEKLIDKSICGFMLMIDSNPKQVIDEYNGSFTLIAIDTVGDDDSDLNKLYAAPYISGWKVSEGFTSSNVTTQRIENVDGVNAEIAYSVSVGQYPRVEATIANYKSEYTTVKMEVKGDNVQTLTIAIKYTLKSSADNSDYNYLSSFDMAVGSNWETLEYDFSTLEELIIANESGLTTVPGSYVKKLNPTAIYFFVDGNKNNSGKLYVRNVSFDKPQEGGSPRVTSTWTLGAKGITKSGVQEGGIGTLTYNQRQSWNPVTINVASYDSQYSVLVVRVKFYDESSNLGIALGYGSERTVVLQSKGMTPEPGFNVKLVSHTQEKGTDDNGDYTFHTITIDFTNASATKNGNDSLANQSITKILLYVDAVRRVGNTWSEPSAGTPINPARTMQFVGIEFQNPQEENK